ncbi:MAG TPA: SulP family inorganic anion transporter [Magnetospirillaceae bacterium]|jgi:SulP family sulfate permease
MSAIVRNVGAGLVASLLALAYCLSYGALIFAGPLQPFLGQGVSTALITGAVIAIVLALTSGFRVAVAGPDSNTTVLLAAMIATLAPKVASKAPADALITIMGALSLATAVTGVIVFVVGWRRIGKFVRFIPYPVIAGFLAATGWLMVSGATRMSTGVSLSLFKLMEFKQALPATLAMVTLGWALLLGFATGRYKNAFVLPALLIGCIILADLAMPLLGVSLSEARTDGIMFAAPGGGRPIIPILTDAYLHIDWSIPASALGDMGSVAVMAILAILLNATSVELATRTEVDLDRELRMAGLANIVSALLGGFAGNISVGRTMLARTAGGTGRLSGVVVGLVALAVLTGASGAIELIPRFVLGGLLLMLGLRLLRDWVIASHKRLSVPEWLVVVAIVLITAWFGFLPGLLVGVLAACVIFCMDVSRIEVIRHQFGLNERSSSVVRSADNMSVLRRHGSAVQILELEGYVFFGSAYGLQELVRALVAEKKPKTVVFDFAAVSGIDSSAGASFAKIRGMLADSKIHQTMSGLSPEMIQGLKGAGGMDDSIGLCASLDVALEEGESQVLAEHNASGFSNQPLSSWLGDALGGAEFASVLVSYLTPAQILDGNRLCRQGDPTDTLLFIEQGRVSVMIEKVGQAPLRVRVFGTHTIVGEMGFFLDAPRTATLLAEDGAVVWALSRAAFTTMKKERPDLVTALFTYVVRLQSERLDFATRQIAVLQR